MLFSPVKPRSRAQPCAPAIEPDALMPRALRDIDSGGIDVDRGVTPGRNARSVPGSGGSGGSGGWPRAAGA